MAFSYCLVLVTFVGAAMAFSGQYIPKSFYVIDENGQKSDVVFIRNRRDLEIPLLRVRRGGGNGNGAYSYSSSSSQASASSGSGSGYGGGGNGGGEPVNFDDFIPDISPDLQNFAANFPDGLGGGAGARSFASSSSSGGGNGGGYGNSGYNGGQGAGQRAGYDGPILFSRFGEDRGTGVNVRGAAQGPNAAFSSSSSSVDGDGKIKYSVQSGKY